VYFAVKHRSAGKDDKNQRKNNKEGWIPDENKLNVYSMMLFEIIFLKTKVP
jgi:hypothetical protein